MCLSLFSSKQCILYIVIHCMLHIVLKKIMTNTRLQIRFGFRVILNNQGLGKCYQPQPSAGLITLTSTLIIPHIIRKTSLNNCLVWSKGWCIGESPSPCTNVAQCGFKSRHQRHVWVEFVVDSPRDFSPVTCTPVFPSP